MNMIGLKMAVDPNYQGLKIGRHFWTLLLIIVKTKMDGIN